MFLSQLNHKSNSPGKILCNQFTLIWQHNYPNTSLHEFPRHREEAGELHTVFKYFSLEGTHFVSAQSSLLRLIIQSQAKCMKSQRMLSPECSRMENEMSCREVTATIQLYSLFLSSLETNTRQKHHKREKIIRLTISDISVNSGRENVAQLMPWKTESRMEQQQKEIKSRYIPTIMPPVAHFLQLELTFIFHSSRISGFWETVQQLKPSRVNYRFLQSLLCLITSRSILAGTTRKVLSKASEGSQVHED